MWFNRHLVTFFIKENTLTLFVYLVNLNKTKLVSQKTLSIENINDLTQKLNHIIDKFESSNLKTNYRLIFTDEFYLKTLTAPIPNIKLDSNTKKIVIDSIINRHYQNNIPKLFNHTFIKKNQTSTIKLFLIEDETLTAFILSILSKKFRFVGLLIDDVNQLDLIAQQKIIKGINFLRKNLNKNYIKIALILFCLFLLSLIIYGYYLTNQIKLLTNAYNLILTEQNDLKTKLKNNKIDNVFNEPKQNHQAEKLLNLIQNISALTHDDLWINSLKAKDNKLEITGECLTFSICYNFNKSLKKYLSTNEFEKQTLNKMNDIYRFDLTILF